MSSNIIQNEKNINQESELNIEGFEQLPAYIGNNISKATSFSALNIGKKNVHNSVFTNLDSTQNILNNIKNGYKLKGDLKKIDPYFYNENPGDAIKCAKECKDLLVGKDGSKYNPCAGFEYDKNSKTCSLYNSIPNDFEEDDEYISGIKKDYDFNMSKLTSTKRDNVLNRIGSYFLQKNQNIINDNPKHDLNKCIENSYGTFHFKSIVYFNVGNGEWAGSRTLNNVYLSYKGSKVSHSISLKNEDFRKGDSVRKELIFVMKSYKADSICIDIGYDGLALKSIDFCINLNGLEQRLFTIDTKNKLMKNGVSIIDFPETIDLNSLGINMNGSKIYFGTNKDDGRSLKWDWNEQSLLDSILRKPNFSIVIDYSVQNVNSNWRNIFHYGNSNWIRRPAMWIHPNQEWYMHFRIGTNRSWNSGINFWIPNQFRKRNLPLSLKIDFIQYVNENNNQPCFMLSVSCNDVFIGNYPFNNYVFQRVQNNAFYIKDPWYVRNGYSVKSVAFSSAPLTFMTSSRKRGTFQDATKFNNFVNKLKPPFYFIRVNFVSGSNKYLVYKRLTSIEGINAFEIMNTEWSSTNSNFNINGNELNKDYEMYQNFQDALNGNGKIDNFNSGSNFLLYLFANNDSYLNLMDKEEQKIKGFDADPYCVYNNIDNPVNKFKGNLKALVSGDINSNSSPNHELIQSNLGDLSKTMGLMKNLNNSLSEDENNNMLDIKYAKDALNISGINKENQTDSANIDGLIDAVGISNTGNDIIESFDNKNNKNNLYLIGVLVLLLIIFLYFYFNPLKSKK
jgi:hypothetical protein